MADESTNQTSGGWEALAELARDLRSESGCPWDRAQSVRSLLPYLVEESHEALHAAETGDRAHLAEELGDACFVLALILRAAEDEELIAFDELAARTTAKIKRRHPHVFGGASVESAEEVSRNWEAIKRAEQAAKGEPPAAPGSLSPASPALPALWQAVKLQSKAAAVGFDWPDHVPVIEKVFEETREVSDAAAAEDLSNVREEIGDLLFAVVNLARKLEVDPESALRAGNEKFRRRFNRMMEIAAARGDRPESLGLERLDLLWNEVKAASTTSPGQHTTEEPPASSAP